MEHREISQKEMKQESQNKASRNSLFYTNKFSLFLGLQNTFFQT